MKRPFFLTLFSLVVIGNCLPTIKLSSSYPVDTEFEEKVIDTSASETSKNEKSSSETEIEELAEIKFSTDTTIDPTLKQSVSSEMPLDTKTASKYYGKLDENQMNLAKDILLPQADLILDPVEHSRDMSSYLSEPIEIATKLLIDLEEHVKSYLGSDEVSSTGPSVYSPNSENSIDEGINRQSGQIQTLVDEVNRLSSNLETTISELVTRRRYVTAATLRSVLNYLKRVRISLERVQHRLNALQAATAPGLQAQSGSSGSSEPISEIPGAQFFITIRDRITSITEEVSSLVNRIRASFAPSSTVTPLI